MDYGKLYRIFSKYEKPNTFEACPCCIDEEEKEILLSRDLQNLNEQDLGQYASSVFLTVGAKKDFMYFFPKILELSLEDKFSSPDQEVIFRSIANSDWTNWDDDERNIVLDLAIEKFDKLLQEHADSFELDTLLCAIAHIENDLSIYLNKLEKEENVHSFQEFITHNIKCYTKQKLENAFWEDLPEQEQQVIHWMKSDKVRVWLFSEYGMSI